MKEPRFVCFNLTIQRDSHLNGYWIKGHLFPRKRVSINITVYTVKSPRLERARWGARGDGVPKKRFFAPRKTFWRTLKEKKLTKTRDFRGIIGHFTSPSAILSSWKQFLLSVFCFSQKIALWSASTEYFGARKNVFDQPFSRTLIRLRGC